MDEFTRLAVIEDRARDLHEFFWKNTGDTADYPIRLVVDDTEIAKQLANKLTRLKVALDKVCPQSVKNS